VRFKLKETKTHYAEFGKMQMPEVVVRVSHDPTFGQNHVIDVLGQWVEIDCSIPMRLGDTKLVELPLTPDVQEAYEFTFDQLQTLYTELNMWYIQFSKGQPDAEMGSIHGPLHYHRTAAAMYYSPVFSQWVQHLKKQGYIKLAPVCDRLTRSNSFRYETPMSPELHTALSTGFNLLQAVEAAKENANDINSI
jgi:hypothetical protein